MIDVIDTLDLKKRLIKYMKENGIGVKKTARLIGISYLSLKRFLEGSGRHYTATLFKIAHYLDMLKIENKILLRRLKLRKKLSEYMEKKYMEFKECAELIGVQKEVLKRFLDEDGNPHATTIEKVENFLNTEEGK